MKMQLSIDSQQKNPLLGRTEVSGTISFSGATPSNKEVIAAIAQQMLKEEQLVAVKNIYTKFSRPEANFQAGVYDSIQVRMKVERKTKYLRQQQEAASKKIEDEKSAPGEAKKLADERVVG